MQFVPSLTGLAVWLCCLPLFVPPVRADEADAQLQLLSRAGADDVAPAAARAARDSLASRGVAVLPRLLVAMDTTNPVAANWYRTIYEDIVAHELDQPQPQLPLELLKEHVRNSQRQGRSRRLVLELIDRLDPQFRPRLIPSMIDDREFRADAIALVLQTGDAASAAGDKDAAKAAYLRAFEQARRADQVNTAAGKLKALGQEVSVAAHLGYVVDWYLIGPFDAPGVSGFARAFPPEQAVDLEAAYPGQNATELRWKRHREGDPFGQINLNQVLVSTREAVGYAYAEIESPAAKDVQVRCGADDNCTVWLNGVRILAREQWLNGSRPDRFVAPARLQAGTNRVLVKICQGPQHVDPSVPNNWSMQLRFCDADGLGAAFKPAFPP